ncbi:MAG TPA: hypothetical protein VJJ24_01470 [Candidatus Paceibacterota bacterium]
MIRVLDSLTRRKLFMLALTLTVAFTAAAFASSASAAPAKKATGNSTLVSPAPAATDVAIEEPVPIDPDGYPEPTQCYQVEYSWFWNGIVSKFVETVTNLTTGVSVSYRNLNVSHYDDARGHKPERGSGSYEYCDSWSTDPPKG